MNNKGTDETAHPWSLISFLDSVIPIVLIPEIPRHYLASVAEHVGLSLTWSHASGDRFSHDASHSPRLLSFSFT